MKITVLVGMIASGKSTYARKLADEGAVIVCFDDLTEGLHGRYRYEPEKRLFYRRVEEDIVRRAHECKLDAVIDRTHLTRESRQRWVNFAKWPSFAEWELPEVVAVAFPIEAPEVHARRRFEADPRGRSYEEWLAVAQHHHTQATTDELGSGPDREGFAEVSYHRRVEEAPDPA